MPFCEAASLEEADTDDSLADLWANVLLSAQQYDDTRHLLYLRILREITKREAEFLRLLVEESKAAVFSENRSWRSLEDAELFDKERIELFTDELPTDFDPARTIQAVIDCLECPGLWFRFVGLMKPVKRETTLLPDSYYDLDRDKKYVASVQVLKGLGIVENFLLRDVRVGSHRNLFLWCDGLRITDLGIAFYRAVTRNDFKKSFENEANSPEEHSKLHN